MNLSSKFRLNLENQMILLYSKALRIKSLVIRGCFIMSESYKLQNQSNFFTKLSDKIFFLWKLHSKRGTDPFTSLHNRRKAFYFLAKALHCYSYYFTHCFIKTSRILIRLNDLIFYGFQSQNVLVLFIFYETFLRNNNTNFFWRYEFSLQE